MNINNVTFGDLYKDPSRNGIYKEEKYHGSGWKIVNMGELFNFDFINNQEMNRVQLTNTEMRSFKLEDGDLLFGRRSLIEDGAGKCSIVVNPTDPTTFESSIIRVRIDKEKVNPQFLFYYFKSYYGRGRVRAIVSGVNVKGIRGRDLKKIKLSLPYSDTGKQERVASLLSSYDTLIDINCKRIQLLEESARLLFREWFVYFKFPGHKKVRIIKDGISKTPEGWIKEKVVNVVSRIPPGELYDQETAEPTGSVPILDQGQSGIIGYHNNEPSVIASLDNPVIVFANHTCNQRIINFPFSAIQNVFPFLPSKENYRNIYWLHYATDNLVQLNAYKGHWPEFMAKNILLPPEDLCDKFGGIVSLIHKQIFNLSIQNQKLTQARDLLLPKLMKGEIRV